MTETPAETSWLGLIIGNSRLHWAGFQQQRWLGTWHTKHLSSDQIQALIDQAFSAQSWLGIAEAADLSLPAHPPQELWVASVVAAQAEPWQPYGWVHRVQQQLIPIARAYNTLGLDRLLALLGAGLTYGWPVLVIDAGTALTLTAGQAAAQDPANRGRFIGGAILPGLNLQAQTLAAQTDALPKVPLPDSLPPRWAKNTVEAIQSGILYSTLSGLQGYISDWWQQYPGSQVVLTGGDGQRLHAYLQQDEFSLAGPIRVDEHLAFWGLQAYRSQFTDR